MGIAILALSFLLSFAAIADILRTPVHLVRGLSPSVWLLIVILIPYLGVLAWVVAGKPTGLEGDDDETDAVPRPRPPVQRVMGPDDDPAFLAALSDRIRDTNEEQ